MFQFTTSLTAGKVLTPVKCRYAVIVQMRTHKGEGLPGRHVVAQHEIG